MFRKAFETVSAAARTVTNYTNLVTPHSIEELRHNQRLRHHMLTDALVKLKGLNAHETASAKQFWATQTAVLINYLNNNAERFNYEFNLQLNGDMCKDKLIAIIDQLLLVLQGEDDEKKKSLLQPLIQESHASVLAQAREPDNSNPGIIVQCADSIAFARKLVAEDKTIVIMDAANAQRPGAGAYERGTFQEALTRSTDLYWKILADFNNVLEKAVNEKRTSLIHKQEDLRIDVISFQASYLEMILYFIKQTLIQPDYFDRSEAREIFFNYANQIYGRIQNTVLEIPGNQAFSKYCQIMNLVDVQKTTDLFENDGKLKIDVENRVLGNIYIVEVAAPDLRATEGAVDRSCTVDDARRDNKDPNEILRQSIENAIRKVVEVNADALILNAFGCKAFENKPEVVASIFAQVLLKNRKELQGKKIYFIDLDRHMCNIFSKTFNEALGILFDFNCQDINGVRLQVRHGNLQGVSTKDTVFAPTETARQSYRHGNGAPIAPDQALLPVEQKTKNLMSLKTEFVDLLGRALRRDNNGLIHLPLIGSGKRGFHPCDCIQALIEAIEQVSKDHPQLKNKQIILHIPHDQKYQTVIDWLIKERAPDAHKEIRKYYQLIHPDMHRRKNFGGGLFSAHLRIAFNDKWKSYTKIANNLYLGTIPTTTEAPVLHRSIPNLKQIISCVEDFELAGVSSYTNIQTASDWARYGVEQHQVFVKDGHADDFPIIEMAKTVGKMLRRMNNNEAVYVHCKAGRSRSATMVALALYFRIKQEGDNPNIQEIYDYLKTVRPEVSLTSVEIATMKAVIALIEKRPELLHAEIPYHQTIAAPIIAGELSNHIDHYLSSDKGKADIAQLPAFKDLKYNALRNREDAEWTQRLLNDVFALTNGKWLAHSCKYNNPFLTAFREAVVELLAQQMNVLKATIMHALDVPVIQIAPRPK